MRVLYDVTDIGASVQQSRHPTGIFRVVENLAFALHASDECELTFYTTWAPALLGYMSYRKSHPNLAGVPLLDASSRLKRRIGRFYDRVSALDRRHSASAAQRRGWLGRLAPATRMERMGLRGAIRTLESLRPSFDCHRVGEAQLLHSPVHALPECTRSLLSLPRVLTVYDLLPVIRPQFFQEGHRMWLQGVLNSLSPRDWVCTISQATKDDLCGYMTIDPERVFVTPLAASPVIFCPCADEARLRAVRDTYGIPDGPYLLSVCTLEPRKNIDHVIRCFVRLVKEQKINDLSLVLAGGKGWKDEKIFEALDAMRQEQHLKERVVVTGYAPDEDLSPLYSGALAFVYPSLYEGFGLPPLEAMQCGTPVITSNTSSLPEVVGEAGIMLRPHDEDALCAAMLTLYSDGARRAELSSRALERAAQFSWQHCAQRTIACYHAALGTALTTHGSQASG